ncbi:MAG: PP2C family protein-serine/threonine phosphatase [Actinomycetota bacterium]
MSQSASESGNGSFEAHAIHEKISWAYRSDPGLLRTSNEDYAGAHIPGSPDDVWQRNPLFVLADGMGGYAAGEVASRLAVDTTIKAWLERPAGPAPQVLRACVRDANVAVFDAAHDYDKRGMGTTLVALALGGKDATIAHVGDSRAYLVRNGVCTQLTSDHSRVGEMLRMQLLTPEQAATHPARSMITRSIGTDPVVQIDLIKESIQQGDVFVLCSDGLWDLVSRGEIARVCNAIGSEEAPTPADAARVLIDESLKRGAPDNVTVAIVRVTTKDPIPPIVAKRGLFRRG